MKKNTVIIVGSGGHSCACIDVFERQNIYQIGGFVTRDWPAVGGSYPNLGSDEDLPKLADLYEFAFVAVGQISSPNIRRNLFRHLSDLRFNFPTVVSPSAYVSPSASVGAGSIVMHGAIVNAGAVIGENCIVNTRALVEHGAKVSDHCHISTGAILNGDVCIGEGSFIGSGSTVREGVEIGSDVLVGMGLSVRHHLTSGVRFVG